MTYVIQSRGDNVPPKDEGRKYDEYRSEEVYRRSSHFGEVRIYRRIYEGTPAVRETDYYVARNGNWEIDCRDYYDAEDVANRILAGDRSR